MKKIIALRGAGDTGKTNTLRIVHEALSSISESSIEEYAADGVDLRDVFTINGFKVGIETQGDPGSRLSSSLELFVRAGCELIVCATRTRGETIELVNKLSPLYHVSWRGQSSLSEASLRDESNQAIAKLIIKEAKAALSV